MMKFTPTKIPDVILVEPHVHEDHRGFFFESYREDFFSQHGISIKFVQDNHSRSQKGVLRGLHFQIAPKEQAKLVRVIRGEVFDVAVDIRRGSKTYGQYISEFLSEKNKKMLFVPPGFAHGYLVLQDGTEFVYKCSAVYSPEHEQGVLWNDPDIGIPWPKLDVIYQLSQKDERNPLLRNNPW